MDNLLTDEEIRDFMDCEPSLCDFFNDCESCNCDYKQFYRWVHQKDIEWLEEICDKHDYYSCAYKEDDCDMLISQYCKCETDCVAMVQITRRECPECWKEFKGVGR